MNDFFNFRRFANYAAKIYKENTRRYLIFVGLMLGAELLWFLFLFIGNGQVRGLKEAIIMPAPMMTLILLVFGGIFVMNEMRPFRNRHTAVMSNTLPVSVFERYMFLWGNTTIVLMLVFTVTILLSNCSLVLFGYGNIAEYWTKITGRLPNLYVGYMLVNAVVMVAGTTRFKNHRLSLLLTVMVLLPLAFMPFWLPGYVSAKFCPDGFGFGPYFSTIDVAETIGATAVRYSTVPPINIFSKNIQILPIVVWTFVLWVISYFKLKELQIK